MVSALVGLDGWLFLDGDRNRSTAQLVGELVMSDSDRQGWQIYHRDLAALAAGLGCDQAFLIAPGKASIYTEYHPDRDRADPAVDRFTAAFPQSIHPRTLLREARGTMETFPKTNTHWNEWGAYLAVKQVMERLGRPVPELPLAEFQAIPGHIGDLGSKLSPVVTADTIHHCADGQEFLVYHNGIPNNGRIWGFENSAPVYDQTCLVFGDSFFVNAAKFMAKWFRRLVFVHSTAIDASIARREQPNVIIAEVAERFLIKAPPPMAGFDLRQVIAQKIAEGDPAQAAALIRKQQAYWPEFPPADYSGYR